MLLWALSHLPLGKFRLWWQSTDSNSLKGKGCDKIKHGNTRNHTLLPLPFTTNSILITFSSVHPGMFCQWYKVPRECLTSISAVNSVGIRYTLERKDLTDYKKKIILRNTEILSIPHEIGSILIVCARDHKFTCLGVGRVTRWVTQRVRNDTSTGAPRTIMSLLHPAVCKGYLSCYRQ